MPLIAASLKTTSHLLQVSKAIVGLSKQQTALCSVDCRPSKQLGKPDHCLGAQQPILPQNQGRFYTMLIQILFTIYNALTVLAKNLPSLKDPRMAAMRYMYHETSPSSSSSSLPSLPTLLVCHSDPLTAILLVLSCFACCCLI